LIDVDRWVRLKREAKHRKVSVGVLVREAIDARYPGDADRRAAALQAVLDAEPMEVADPDVLRSELDALRSRRMP
jgi:hypothetical protein